MARLLHCGIPFLFIACASTAEPIRAEAPAPPSPELMRFPSGTNMLGGYMWRPAGPGPFPAIVYNHGSARSPGAHAEQAEFFVPHGYAVFVPHRRGQGESRDAGPFAGDMRGRDLVDELGAEADDVAAATEYLATLPYIDKTRIAAVGCWVGGIESLLAAERAPGLAAAVDFAGGARLWATSPQLQERMKTAASNAKAPVLFIQAANDYDTTPSRTLSALGTRHRLAVLPPQGKTKEAGYRLCVGGANPVWGDEVLAFLHDAGM